FAQTVSGLSEGTTREFTSIGDGLQVERSTGGTIDVKGDISTSVDHGINVTNTVTDVTVNVGGDVSTTSGFGIQTHGTRDEITVEGNVEGGQAGIMADGSSETITAGNVSATQGNVVDITGSDSNVITVNDVTSNGMGGIVIERSANNNIVNAGTITTGHGDSIVISKSDGNKVTAGGITTESYGISLEEADGNTVKTGAIKADSEGISINNDSDGNTVTAGNITDSSTGISINNDSDGNTVTARDITESNTGISISGSDKNKIEAGKIEGATSVSIDTANNNTITAGNIKGNETAVSISSNGEGSTAASNKLTFDSITSEGNGIVIYGGDNSSITVKGDLAITAQDGYTDGIAIMVNDSSNTSIVVEGTIDAGSCSVLDIDNTTTQSTTNLTVFEIKTNDDGNIVRGEDPSLAKVIKAAINYIIHSDVSGASDTIALNSDQSSGGTVGSYTGTDGKSYITATTGTYQVACLGGSTISNLTVDGKASVTQNADGTYSITVKDGGGVKMTVTLQAPDNNNGGNNGGNGGGTNGGETGNGSSVSGGSAGGSGSGGVDSILRSGSAHIHSDGHKCILVYTNIYGEQVKKEIYLAADTAARSDFPAQNVSLEYLYGIMPALSAYEYDCINKELMKLDDIDKTKIPAWQPSNIINVIKLG
ncbi:MAG: NosD domain-containing protein, partial [Eubacteriales bacterium]|nr:NosD domain-containing protein [Eubacteriales bacterium]